MVLRRDMSLNRRLYAWLLGNELTHSDTRSGTLIYQSTQLSHNLWDIAKTIGLDIVKHVEHHYISILKCGRNKCCLVLEFI